MNAIARPAVDDAIRRRPDAADWLNAWWKVACKTDWTSLQDVRTTYPRTDQVGSCLVFDVRGNRYRLIVGVRYATEARRGTLFVKYFLTHADYSKNAWKKDCAYGD